jgi:hypothetical protein
MSSGGTIRNICYIILNNYIILNIVAEKVERDTKQTEIYLSFRLFRILS